MSEAEYNNLVANAVAKGPSVVRALQKRHFNADPSSIEDATQGAQIEFSDRERILNIRKPEKPFSWLLSTAERLYQRERRKQSRVTHLDDLVVEPAEPDRATESYEAAEAIERIFAKIHKRYSEIIKSIDYEGQTFDEIARTEDKPRKAIYDRYENAKKKARETAMRLGIIPPPSKNNAKRDKNNS